MSRISVNSILCFLLYIYNIVFMAYNEHFRNSSVTSLLRNTSILILMCLLLLIVMIYWKYNDGLKLKKNIMLSSFGSFLLVAVLIFGITLYKQSVADRFDIFGHSVKYLCFYLIPIMFGYFWVNCIERENRIAMINSIFYAAVTNFFLFNISNLNLEALRSISWNNSYSSAFESDNAHLYLFLLLFYLYIGNRRKSVICTVLCMLCLKRISFILAPILFLGYKLLPKDKPVNRGLLCVTGLIFAFIPLGLELITTNTFAASFNQLTGLDFNVLTSGRVASVQVLRAFKEQFVGMGSIAYFIEGSNIQYIKGIGYLHCDLLVWFWESSIIAIILYIFAILKFAKIDYHVFFLVAYLLLMLATTHFLDMHLYMTAFFMIAYFIYNDKMYEIEGRQDVF